MTDPTERRLTSIASGRALEHAWATVGPVILETEASALAALRSAFRSGNDAEVTRQSATLCAVEDIFERIKSKIREGERAFAIVEKERDGNGNAG